MTLKSQAGQTITTAACRWLLQNRLTQKESHGWDAAPPASQLNWFCDSLKPVVAQKMAWVLLHSGPKDTAPDLKAAYADFLSKL